MTHKQPGKVLIVDDEQVEREGLRAILHKHMPGLSIALAKHGMEAIEMAASLEPDLILMDIKMPGLSGLETVARIQQRQPDIQFVMVTAYDQFDFARQALKYGVRDYLLKPSRTAEIVETVGRVLSEITAERRARAAQQQANRAFHRMLPVLEADLVAQLLHDHSHEIDAGELGEWLGGQPDREAFVLLIALEAGGEEAAGPFHAALRERVRERAAGWVGALSGRQIPLVLFRESGLSYRAQASSLMQRLLALQRSYTGLRLFAGIGSPYASLAQIRLSYQEALVASADASPTSRFRFYEDLPANRELPDKFPDKGTESAFLDHIRTGRWEDVRETVRASADRWEKHGVSLMHAAQRMLEMLWLISRVLAEAGLETAPSTLSFQMTDYRALRTEVQCELDKLVQAAEEHNKRTESRVVERVKRHILQHSHEDLSLDGIAAAEGMSPFYLSRLFKEETGVNYIDFLTACRIEKARVLMADPAKSLKQIAFEVGYHDPNYFSRVFKKTTGHSPRDYRKRRVGGQREHDV